MKKLLNTVFTNNVENQKTAMQELTFGAQVV